MVTSTATNRLRAHIVSQLRHLHVPEKLLMCFTRRVQSLLTREEVERGLLTNVWPGDLQLERWFQVFPEPFDRELPPAAVPADPAAAPADPAGGDPAAAPAGEAAGVDPEAPAPEPAAAAGEAAPVGVQDDSKKKQVRHQRDRAVEIYLKDLRKEAGFKSQLADFCGRAPFKHRKRRANIHSFADKKSRL